MHFCLQLRSFTRDALNIYHGMLSCSQDSWNNVLLSAKSTACVTQWQLQLSTIRSRDCDQPVPKSERSTKTKQKGKCRLKIRKEKKRMSNWAKAEGERHPSYKLAKWRAPKADKEASCKQAKLYACVLAMCTQWWPTGCLGGVDGTPLDLNQAWQTTITVTVRQLQFATGSHMLSDSWRNEDKAAAAVPQAKSFYRWSWLWRHPSTEKHKWACASECVAVLRTERTFSSI